MLNYNRFKTLYSKSPAFLQSCYGAIPWSLRMGRKYRDLRKFLDLSEYWSREQWHDYQTTELRKLLAYCQDFVPYYQRVFAESAIDVHANDIWQEFKKIPPIDKEDVRENLQDFLSTKHVRSRLYQAATGGTTGKPLSLYYSSNSYHAEWAYKLFFWKLAIGYTPKRRKATFRGVTSGNELWINNPIYNEMRFSPFRIDDKNSSKIIEKLDEYQPEFVHGYPSALLRLCTYYKKLELDPPCSIRGVMLISENYSEQQRTRIAAGFRAPAYSF